MTTSAETIIAPNHNQLPKMSLFQEYVYLSRYSRFVHDKGRRETWPETVARYFDFFEKHLRERHDYALTPELRAELEGSVLRMEVMPSMRALMTAGPALERDHMGGFNCSFIAIDSPRAFAEALAILMAGTGVGFSVERQYVNKLPEVPEELHDSDTVIIVADSKIGWARSLLELVQLLYSGNVPKWDLSRVRPAGAPLKTFGGRASGPEPLDALFKFFVETFKRARGRKLTSIECHDLTCMIGNSVVVGGVRRSALISLSNLSDDRMRAAKTGQWWESTPWRRLANNSAVYDEARPEMGTFMTEWKSLYDSKSGERGIFSRYAARRVIERSNEFRKRHFADLEGVRYRDTSYEFGCNPCVPGDTMVAVADGRNAVSIASLASEGAPFPVYSARRSIGGPARWVTEIKQAVAFKTGVRPLVQVLLSDGTSFRCTADHRLAKAGGGYVEAHDATGVQLEGFFTRRHKRNYRFVNSVSDGHRYQHRMIWEFANGPKPEGYHIDHRVPNGDDSISNLQLLSAELHNEKSGRERSGDLNSVHRIRDREQWIARKSRACFFDRNPRFSGVTDEEIIAAAVQLHEDGVPVTIGNLRAINPRIPKNFSKNRFSGSVENLRAIVRGEAEYAPPFMPEEVVVDAKSFERPDNPFVKDVIETGEVEDVYDLYVEDNHNFYILNDGDEGYVNSVGVLIHNCSEVLLRSHGLCNLSEAVIRSDDTLEDVKRKVRNATILGTFQSTLTDYRFVSRKWSFNAEDERLLGVSLTGIMDNKLTSGQMGIEPLKDALTELRKTAIETNVRLAREIGVPSSVAITCVKPSGTVSSLVDSASGIHARHSRYYVRTARSDVKDPLTQLMIGLDFPHEPDVMAPEHTMVFSFPFASPPGATLFREDVDAIRQLELWKTYQLYYCDHKPSVTITVKEHEWLDVGAWVYRNFEWASGISFLPFSDTIYAQAPYQDCSKEEYEALLAKMPKNVDWSDLRFYEQTDMTTGSQELACSGGSCDIT